MGVENKGFVQEGFMEEVTVGLCHEEWEETFQRENRK